LGIGLAGVDEGHVIAVEPELDHPAVGFRDDRAHRGTGTEESSLGGLHTEDDAIARGDDTLHRRLFDQDVEADDGLGGRG
jgi:hypothetical protein